MNYKFTEKATEAVQMAADLAMNLGHNFLGTEHLLFGLANEGTGVASKILSEQGLDAESIKQEIVEIDSQGSPIEDQDIISPTPRTKRVLDNFGLSYDFSDTDSKNIGIHLNIISSIENKCPVIVAGHIPSKPGYGHAFVLDGGKIMSRQVSTKLYTVGKTISEGIYNTYEGKDLYYHCNLGWGGSSNGWYSPDAVTSDSYECYFYVYNIKKK